MLYYPSGNLGTLSSGCPERTQRHQFPVGTVHQTTDRPEGSLGEQLMLKTETSRKKLCRPFCLHIICKYYSGPFLGIVSVPKFRRSQEIQREMEDIKGPQSDSIKLSF